MSADVRVWLEERLDDVPGEFLPWLDLEEGSDGDETVREALARRGVDALSEALARPGRNRTAAFHLLAADAYLTYACEAVVEESDVETGLIEILRLVAAEAG